MTTITTTRRYAQHPPSSLPSLITSAFYLHPLPSPAQPPLPYYCHTGQRRAFHATRPAFATPAHDDGKNETHYDALKVPYDASVSDIKRSFYKLSKVHHPDHNPKDPHASRRFMRISEAYAVLGQADKRALYDRDVMRRHHMTSRHHQQQQHGKSATASHRPNASYHSTGPAGGRPASGLSRRRTTFKGPPPSFFRNAGMGGTRSGGSATGTGTGSGHTSEAWARPETWAHPFETKRNPHAPHFDKVSNERTQRNLDERLAARRAAAQGTDSEALAEPSTLGGFLIIMGAVMAGMIVPVLLVGDWRKKTKTRASQQPTEKKT